MPQDICTIQNFTGVYAEQPFMQGLRGRDGTRYIDCSDIPGTDCYCDDEAVEAIRKRIADAGITHARGIHFFDNGNYHYMSKIWTDMVQEPFSLVVFDHHPDMQEPRFGNILSCGGWVLEVLRSNPFVQGVTLIGVADHLHVVRDADEILRAVTAVVGHADVEAHDHRNPGKGRYCDDRRDHSPRKGTANRRTPRENNGGI